MTTRQVDNKLAEEKQNKCAPFLIRFLSSYIFKTYKLRYKKDD